MKLTEQAAKLAHDQEVRRARLASSDWECRYKEAIRELEVAAKRLEFVDSIKRQQRDVMIERLKSSGKGVAQLIWSDWHCEEKVDPAQVAGLNAYSPDVFSARVKALLQHTVLMLEHARELCTIQRLVIWALGDFITGYIHEELKKSNYMAPTEAALMFQDQLHSALKFLRAETKLPILVVCKVGNHGRTTEKMQAKDQHVNSFEWLAFKTAERWFQVPGVEWIVEPGYHTYLDINGRWYCGHHGHAIRYKGGVGGIYVPIAQKQMRWNRTKPAYRYMMGHLHQYTPMTDCIVNSSLIGYSEYSIQNGFAYEPPSQSLTIDAASRGAIYTERVFCD